MYSSARRSNGPGVVRARFSSRRSGHRISGSFSAVETVWKFIPKIAGTPTFVVRLWS